MLDLAVNTAKSAGKILLEKLGNISDVQYKSNEKDFVTEADKLSEEMIIKTFLNETPGFGIIAEESGLSDTPDAEYFWVIDPLDGTKNFAHSLPIFSISIGLVKNDDIICGVIYDPTRNEMFKAEKGKGAFLNDKRIYVSKTDRISKSLLVTGFPYSIKQNPDFALQRFLKMVREGGAVRRLGSAAIDMAYTAAGLFDGFWEVSLHPWDVAAGILLVKEAGGVVTDFSGVESKIRDKQYLATNGQIHNEFIKLLKESEQIKIIE